MLPSMPFQQAKFGKRRSSHMVNMAQSLGLYGDNANTLEGYVVMYICLTITYIDCSDSHININRTPETYYLPY